MVTDTTKELKSSQISCFVTSTEYREFEKLAKAGGRSISGFARHLIFKNLKEKSK